MQDDLLPSLHFHGDEPKPSGFAVDLSDPHVEAASRALTELANATESTASGRTRLNVCFCSARYVPGLPFNLYSFHIADFDDEGNPLDEVRADAEIRYAVVVNQPVEVQREVALLFVYDLLFRTVALSDPKADANQADVIAARATDAARAEFRDRMRAGWKDAARSVAARASEEGISLQIRYQLDPFPDRESLVRRMSALRRTYNTIELAREFVDKVVSLVAGRDPRVSVPGAPDNVRLFAQRKLVELGLRHYTTQTLRDAQVLGNGYLVLPTAGGETPYNLRPETVEVLGDGRFAIIADGGRREVIEGRVLHDLGVEQFASPYGFSALEAVVPESVSRQTLADVERKTLELVERVGGSAEHRQYLVEVQQLVQRHREESDQRLQKLLWYPREWVPDAVEGLYFPGQERM